MNKHAMKEALYVIQLSEVLSSLHVLCFKSLSKSVQRPDSNTHIMCDGVLAAKTSKGTL